MGWAMAERAPSTSRRRRRRLSPEEFARVEGSRNGDVRRAHLWRVGNGIEEHGERGHTGDAVGDGVVHLDEQPHTLVRQTGQEPHLPQRPGPVQRAAAKCLAGDEELSLVARRRHRVHVDVLGDVERLGIRPHRPPQPHAGPVQNLTKPGHPVQPSNDGHAHRLDQKSAIGVEQRFAVEDDKRPDVLGPTLLLRPDQHEIRSGHTIQAGPVRVRFSPDRFLPACRWPSPPLQVQPGPRSSRKVRLAASGSQRSSPPCCGPSTRPRRELPA